MTMEEEPAIPRKAEPSRRGERFTVAVSVISAFVSLASLGIAWSALNAYPNQLKMTERLRVCIALQDDASEFVSAVTGIESAFADNDIEAYRRASDLAISVDRRVSGHIGVLALLGPDDLRAAAVRVRDEAEAFHDAAAVLEQRGDALSDEVRAYGLALRNLNEACSRALR